MTKDKKDWEVKMRTLIKCDTLLFWITFLRTPKLIIFLDHDLLVHSSLYSPKVWIRYLWCSRLPTWPLHHWSNAYLIKMWKILKLFFLQVNVLFHWKCQVVYRLTFLSDSIISVEIFIVFTQKYYDW